jgi:4-aminobutyrate aminotransferase-like enzyme
MVIEPVLGEGGYVPAQSDFLGAVQRICREHGILFVADEVQTGFGRTGTMFAIEQAGVEPDVIVMAKGIASGFPISAIGASAELMARWPKGSHGGTYGGNPIGCAAALATINVLTEPGFLAHVNERGDQLRAGLTKLVDKHGLDAQVRGPGLMVGLEIGRASRGLHDTTRVGHVIAHARDEGHLLLMNAGTYGNVVRFMPPLVVSEAEIDRCLDVLDAAFAAA